MFQSAPDLIEEFKQFLPDPSGTVPSSGGIFGVLAGAREIDEGEIREKDKKKGVGATVMDKSGGPPKRKKRVLEKEPILSKPPQPKVRIIFYAPL